MAEDGPGQENFDELAAKFLSKKVVDAIDQAEVKKTMDLRLVIVGGLISLSGEINLSVLKVVAAVSAVLVALAVVLAYFFPALAPLMQQVIEALR